MDLVWPAAEHLARYVRALEQGWSPDTQRAAAPQAELARIAQHPDGFLAEQVDREGRGPVSFRFRIALG